MSWSDIPYVRKQKCEEQKECRDEALSLVDDFGRISAVLDCVRELQQREETKRSTKRMVELIAESCNYIINNTSSGIIGRSSIIMIGNNNLMKNYR